MDSTDDELRAHEVPEDRPRMQDVLVEDPRLRLYPDNGVNYVQVQHEAQRREELRDAELKRMEELYARIEKGIDEGMVDLESGAKMLLNVSAARMALGGVGHVYPGAW